MSDIRPDELESLRDVDAIGWADLRALAGVQGPCVSAFLPTSRHGPDTQQAKVRVRNLVRQARDQLCDAGIPASSATELLAPMEGLVDDEPFWQHQADGLALFATMDRMVWLRLAEAFEEQLVVGPAYRLRPLLPWVADAAVFDILALSQNQVRLLRAHRGAVTQLDTGATPTSLDDALRFEDPERQLQVRSAGPGARFHGHGAGEELDKAAIERYFRAVDRGLADVLGPGPNRPPLVLACVGYYAPIFRSVSTHPAILDAVVEGNPEGLGLPELQARAIEVVRPLLDAPRERALARFREAAGTGHTATRAEEVVSAAADGAIDVLLVRRGAPPWWGVIDAASGLPRLEAERRPKQADLLDLAVRDTIRHGGVVHPVDSLPDDLDAAALLRY